MNICGGRLFVLFMGGNFVFTLVCDFDINLCEKNGGDYVMVIFTLMVLIMGSICVLHHIFHRREIFVCLNLIGWCVFVWCKLSANADCLNKFLCFS